MPGILCGCYRPLESLVAHSAVHRKRLDRSGQDHSCAAARELPDTALLLSRNPVSPRTRKVSLSCSRCSIPPLKACQHPFWVAKEDMAVEALDVPENLG